MKKARSDAGLSRQKARLGGLLLRYLET